ncbi:CotY/CotZ family spore coat protein [Chengkuizengella sp. SCS-71B]|uniref:CotY/CotZ family spore coat protein n=1 Tax=Chengkuizengella sp. SCS-71B TaxID=3115290 RepID=UPI0032C22A72
MTVKKRKKPKGNKNCICDALKNIGDVIILTKTDNTLLYAFGDILNSSSDPLEPCYITVYFQVKEVDKCNQCITLELLKPNEGRTIDPGENCCVPLNQICTDSNLEFDIDPTNLFITVDCNTISSFQIIDL